MSVMTRRTAIQAFVAATLAGCKAAQAFPVGRSIGLLGSEVAGGFPNSAPAFLPMRQVYPAPSGVTSTEPHQFAYFDAVNNTAHGIQWQKRIGVSFGRWPYTYSLVSGPPGMKFGATQWNTAWDGQGDAAYKAGYGQLQWPPTAAISPASPTLISVNITDQDNLTINLQWNIYTSGDITQPGGVHAFLNADTGNDSTGNGSQAAPWQTAAHALGTSATSPGAAPAGCTLIPMGATNAYVFPQTSTNVFTWNSAHKPAAIVGIPGSPSTWDMSSGGLSKLTGGISGTTLTVASVQSANPVQVGQTLHGSGVSESSFLGNISGTTLTITSLLSGTVAIGQTLYGNGISGNTIIAGSGTSWTVSTSQSVATTQMAGVTVITAGSGSSWTVAPSQTVSSGTAMVAVNTAGVGIQPISNGLFMQDVILDGYTFISNYRAFYFGYLNRPVFQGVIWNDAGYGCTSNNNASMVLTIGGGPGYGQYPFVTGCEENNRQSSAQANNCALCEWYSYSDGLVELNSANSPNSQVGESFYMKSDTGYFCMRANLAVFAGCDHGFDWGQAPYQGSGNSESSYNVGVNVGNLNVPEIVGYSWGALAARRNNIVSNGAGFLNQSPNYNMTAPYTGSNTAPYNIGTLTPVISTAATGGSLPAGTWYYVVTTRGITGESSINNSNQTSRMSITTTGSTSVNTVPWLPVPGNNGYRVYRGTSSGGENQYVTVAAGVDSLTDDGTLSWTSGTPPATSTAVSANRFNFDSNVMQNPTQTGDPAGATTGSDGNNQYAASGLLNTTTGLLTVSNGGKEGAQLA